MHASGTVNPMTNHLRSQTGTHWLHHAIIKTEERPFNGFSF